MTTYKELRDHTDNELSFDNLDTAKNYFSLIDDILNRDDWLGTDTEYDEYLNTIKEYIDQISNASSLDELVDVLNEYEPLLFDAGHKYYISTVE